MTRCLPNVLLSTILTVLSLSAQNGPPTSYGNKLGIDRDVRSGSRVIADEFLSGNFILAELAGPIASLPDTPSIQLRCGNVQASDPALDDVQISSGFRPFVRATQTEVSIASSNNNIGVGYNNSAGAHVSPVPGVLIVDRLRLSGYSYSKDGGQLWASAYLPAINAKGATFGDPSVGVDRHGVF